MTIRIDRRPYDVFLSHAHVDAEFADTLNRWLTVAGFRVWFDAAAMAPSDQINQALEKGIRSSRAVIILASAAAVGKGWVQHEIGVAHDERNRDRSFRLVSICVGDADFDDVGAGFSQIRVAAPVLDTRLALALLRAFHPPRPPIDPRRQRDVYVSLGWQPGEEVLNHAVCAEARAEGFRLIGDDRNRHSYGPDRIREIMQTCGGFLAIIPGRQAETAWAEDDPDRGKSDYRYFLREADCAAALALPSLVVAPEGLRRIDGDDSDWLRIPPGTTRATDAVKRALAALFQDWRTPANEDLIFFATDLRRDALLDSGELKALIEAISGMRVVVGTDLQGGSIQDSIMATIAAAHLVIADLSGATDDAFSLNVAVEAGIAKSHARHLRMMARGPMRRPPFMLQSAGQLEAYGDDVERIAVIRKVASDFRRMIYD